MASEVKKMTKKTFLKQFPVQVNVDEIKHILSPAFSPVQYEGVEILRALQQIFICVQENGRDIYYTHR